MNHPKREEWVPYLFGETNSETRQALSAHLKACPECRQELGAWERSLKRLDAWKLPPTAKPALKLVPLLNWAAAAAVILLAGLCVGWVTASKVNTAKVRAAIEPELRRELRQEFAQMFREELAKTSAATLAAASQQTEQSLAVFAKAIEDGRAEDNRAIYAALDKIESENFMQYVSLKKDVDTVAVNTEHQLVQLADSNSK